MSTRTLDTRCCIVGGGPAGMMLGLMLARAGTPITILEKHADFLRDFRGDTVHPSTLVALEELGLRERFDNLPQRRVDHMSVRIGDVMQPAIDFRGLKPYPFLALTPQWDFLNLLAEEGGRLPQFDLRMRCEAVGLMQKEGRVVGVKARTPQGDITVHSDLVIACDGRHSTLRAAADMQVRSLGAPMDVLWFRLPRKASDPEDTFGIIGTGHMMVLLNRTDYWQTAYLVPKGGADELREQPIDDLRNSIAKLATFLADRIAVLDSWDAVKTLEVRVDRLERWYRAGLLAIGDAAHAMSPIGGVGINLAIQDAIAAANILTPALRTGERIPESLLHAVQKRRLPPTRLIQAVQVQLQKRVISKALSASGRPFSLPALARFMLRFRPVRHIPARLFGYGFRQEHVQW